MSSYFVLSVHFLDRVFHGRADGAEPEWPPSPLRLFQALVAAAARLPGGIAEHTQALSWLEQQPDPWVLAPAGAQTDGYCLSVPNNAMDVVAKAWSRGNYSNSGDASPAKHRTMKRVRATHLLDGDSVHYVWRLDEQAMTDTRRMAGELANVARQVVAFGWGIDLAVGQGRILTEEEVDRLSGEKWLPCGETMTGALRVPAKGTLDDLLQRHRTFLGRIDGGRLNPPSPLTAFRSVSYRRTTDPAHRPVAAFELRKLDGNAFRPFDTARRGLTVAGMMRYAAESAARNTGRPAAWIDAVVLGHGESRGSDEHVPVGPRRFAYLPVPSVEGRGTGKEPVVGSVRRVIVTCFADDGEAEIAWARRMLPGQELVEKHRQEPVAVLAPIHSPTADRVLRFYTQEACCWSTVTPVVLPGFDDPVHYRRRLKRGASAAEQKQLLARLSARIDGLLRKAITQAGFTDELARHAEIEWRKTGFRTSVEHADRYGVPDHLRRFPRYHLRIRWCDNHGKTVQVPGPVCIGGGRYFGLGLFAAEGGQ